jgi:hypothetical protein
MSKITLLKDRSEIKNAKELQWNLNGASRHSFISDADRSNVFTLSDLEVVVFYPYFDGFHKSRNGLERRDQNPLAKKSGLPWVDWTGNFEPGESLLWTGNQALHDGPLKIMFRPLNGKKVKAVGLQMQVACRGKFTAVIDTYDSSDQYLGGLFREGFSADHFDPKRPEKNAPFIGVSASDISRIELSTNTICPGGFCINQLSIDY